MKMSQNKQKVKINPAGSHPRSRRGQVQITDLLTKNAFMKSYRLLSSKDAEQLQNILEFLKKYEATDETQMDWHNVEMQETIMRIEHNLKNGHHYFKAPEQNSKWYNAVCEDCGWSGSSQYLFGGHAIADTGDYDDVYCPICNSTKISD